MDRVENAESDSSTTLSSAHPPKFNQFQLWPCLSVALILHLLYLEDCRIWYAVLYNSTFLEARLRQQSERSTWFSNFPVLPCYVVHISDVNLFYTLPTVCALWLTLHWSWLKKAEDNKETDRWRQSGGQSLLVIDETTGDLDSWCGGILLIYF